MAPSSADIQDMYENLSALRLQKSLIMFGEVSDRDVMGLPWKCALRPRAHDQRNSHCYWRFSMSQCSLALRYACKFVRDRGLQIKQKKLKATLANHARAILLKIRPSQLWSGFGNDQRVSLQVSLDRSTWNRILARSLHQRVW